VARSGRTSLTRAWEAKRAKIWEGDTVEMPEVSKGTDEEYQQVQRRHMAQLSHVFGLSAVEMALIRACAFKPRLMADVVRNSQQSETNKASPQEVVEHLNWFLTRGYVRTVSEEWLDEWHTYVRTNGIAGPMAGFPARGAIDVTCVGAGVVKIIEAELATLASAYWGGIALARPRFARVVERRERIVVAEETLALEIGHRADECAKQYGFRRGRVINTSAVGPWRNRWWERYATGICLELEMKEGYDAEGILAEEDGRLDDEGIDTWMHEDSAWPGREVVREVSASYGLTLTEWVTILAVANRPWSERRLSGETTKLGRELWSSEIDVNEANEAIESCMTKGVLWRIDETAVRTISRLVAEDGAAGPFVPIPRADEGLIDLSPVGAEKFVAVIGQLERIEGFQSIWQCHGLHDANRFAGGYNAATSECVQEVFCYGRNETERYVRSCEMRQGVQVRSVTALGAWCVYWWDPLPFGYRVEIVSEDCSALQGA
jgi:hypothetical protein